MKKHLLIAVSAALCSVLTAQTIQSWEWNHSAQDYYTTPDLYSKPAIECDDFGHIYMSGSAMPGTNIGGILTQANGPYLAKLDMNGNALRVNSLYCGAINDIACDNNGNVYISGFFQDSLNFDGTILYTTAGPSNIPYTDGIVAKFDSTGALAWVRQGGYHGTTYTTSTTRVASIALDNAGNIYATGNYTYAANFGSLTLPSTSLACAYVIKYNNAGTEQWINYASCPMLNTGSTITVGSSNEIYFSGWASNANIVGITLGTTTLYRNIFLAKIDASGAFVWAKGLGGNWCYTGADDAGNVYALTDSLYKFSPAGNVMWEKYLNGSPAVLRVKNNKLLIGAGMRDYYYTQTYGFAGLPDYTLYGPWTSGGTSSCVIEADTAGTTLRTALLHIKPNWNAYSEMLNLTSDVNGNIYADGVMRDTVYFCTQEVVTTGWSPSVNLFWAKVSASASCTPPPNPPLNLTAASTAHTVSPVHQITLNWNDNSSNEDGFVIERTDWISPWQVVGSVAQNITTYLDTALPDSTFYCYRVKAFNTNGNIGYSNQSCDTTWASVNSIFSNNSFSIYPNPCNDVITIDGENTNDDLQFMLYSSLGVLVHTQQVSTQGTTTVNLGDLPAGMYTYSIVGNNSVLVRSKLLIE